MPRGRCDKQRGHCARATCGAGNCVMEFLARHVACSGTHTVGQLKGSEARRLAQSAERRKCGGHEVAVRVLQQAMFARCVCLQMYSVSSGPKHTLCPVCANPFAFPLLVMCLCVLPPSPFHLVCAAVWEGASPAQASRLLPAVHMQAAPDGR